MLYALKELPERLARREYTLLRSLDELSIPAVDVIGVAVDRGPDMDAVLVTRFLAYATTYRAVFSRPARRPAHRPAAGRAGRAAGPAAPVRVLLGRLLAVQHAVPLRRRHAGGLPGRRGDQRAAPAAVHGQRDYDLELAQERVFGELLDLQAGELLPSDVDPLDIAEQLQQPVRRAVGRADPGGDPAPGRAAVPHRPAAAAAQPARLRRRGGRADQHPGREPAAGPDPGGRVRRAQPSAVPAGRDRRGREPGPPAAERHRLVPGLAGAEGRPPGARLRGGQPVAGRGVRAGGGGDPGRPARAAGPDRDLPRDPGAPVVHVGAGRPGRGHPGRGPVLLRPGAARRARAAGRAQPSSGRPCG